MHREKRVTVDKYKYLKLMDFIMTLNPRMFSEPLNLKSIYIL